MHENRPLIFAMHYISTCENLKRIVQQCHGVKLHFSAKRVMKLKLVDSGWGEKYLCGKTGSRSNTFASGRQLFHTFNHTDQLFAFCLLARQTTQRTLWTVHTGLKSAIDSRLATDHLHQPLRYISRQQCACSLTNTHAHTHAHATPGKTWNNELLGEGGE